MHRTAVGLVVVALLLPGAAAAQPPPRPATQAASAETAGYYFLLGRYHEWRGEPDKSVEALKRAVQLAPKSAELRAELAAVYARQDRAAEAIAAAEEALALDPQNREANRIAGTIYAAAAEQRRALRDGESPQLYAPRAIAALERARQAGLADANAELVLARLYLQAEAYDRAIPLLSRIVAAQPGYPEAAILLATAQDAAGQTAAAVETLTAMLEETPRSFRGQLLLAELSEKQGEWKQAADAYERAQQLNTRGLDLSSRRAAALINAGQATAARDLLRDAAARPDASPVLLYLFAAAQKAAGDLAGAEATARRLRTAAPEDPRGMYVLAQVLEARGDHKGAEESLREILERHPKDAGALNYLGYMLAERGERLDEAVDLVKRALEIEPGNPAYLDSLGWAYFQQGRLELADPPLTDAAAKMPKNSVIQDHLGDLRFRQRRYAEAAAAWEQSLAGDGDSIDRERILKKIQDAKSRMDAR